jgi:hypothetical protein
MLSLLRKPMECPKPGCLNRLSNSVTHLGIQSQNYGKGGEQPGTLQRQRAPRQTSLLLSLKSGVITRLAAKWGTFAKTADSLVSGTRSIVNSCDGYARNDRHKHAVKE